MIRNAGGNNDHPDSIKFSYLFKLMSVYSMLKPPKGSNISSEETFTTFCHFMNENTVIGRENDIKFTAEDVRMFAVDHGAVEFEDSFDAGDYDAIIHEFGEVERCTLEYFCGYILKKVTTRFSNCENCVNSLKGNEADKLLAMRDKFKVLHVPSPHLVSLIAYLEKNVDLEIGCKITNLLPDTFF